MSTKLHDIPETIVSHLKEVSSTFGLSNDERRRHGHRDEAEPDKQFPAEIAQGSHFLLQDCSDFIDDIGRDLFEVCHAHDHVGAKRRRQ